MRDSEWQAAGSIHRSGSRCRCRRVLADPAGLTLLEILLALVIGAILVAVAVPLYASYRRDAIAAEGKAMAAAVLKTLQGCVQGRPPETACTRTDVVSRVGLDGATFATGDGRWTLAQASLARAAGSVTVLSGVVGITGAPGHDTNAVGIGMHVSSGGVVLRCRMDANTVPGPTDGQPC